MLKYTQPHVGPRGKANGKLYPDGGRIAYPHHHYRIVKPHTHTRTHEGKHDVLALCFRVYVIINALVLTPGDTKRERQSGTGGMSADGSERRKVIASGLGPRDASVERKFIRD